MMVEKHLYLGNSSVNWQIKQLTPSPVFATQIPMHRDISVAE